MAVMCLFKYFEKFCNFGDCLNFLDRYLHKNIEQTHERRGEVKKLKEQLAALQQKLEWYVTG